MSASIAIQVLPDVPNQQELCRIVDEVIAYIASTGLRYEVGPFETTVYVKVVYRPEGDILTIDQKIGKYQHR